MSVTDKRFVIKNVLENVPDFTEQNHNTMKQIHFGAPWEFIVMRRNGFLWCFLHCTEQSETKKWSIQTVLEAKLTSPKGAVLSIKDECCFAKRAAHEPSVWAVRDFIKWEQLESSYTVDKKVTIEMDVTIKEMIGFGKENLRSFDGSIKELSDVVLVVEEKRFYLSKLFLALQSSYFKSLLLGNFEESKKSEIVLNNVDPKDFQNFLELIHGESSIDDQTVNGILHLADMYDSPTAIRRCEQFLLKESKLNLKEKLHLSAKYNLNKLKNKYLSEINTAVEIRSVLPADFNDLNPSISTALLEKCLKLC